MRQRLFNDLKNTTVLQNLKVKNIEKYNLINNYNCTQTSKIAFFSSCKILEKYLK